MVGSATGLTPTPASNNITVNPASASSLVFIQQPTDTNSGATITPSPTVKIRDAYDNLRAADNTSTISIGIQNNTGGGTAFRNAYTTYFRRRSYL